jgi:hypothetical protein
MNRGSRRGALASFLRCSENHANLDEDIIDDNKVLGIASPGCSHPPASWYSQPTDQARAIVDRGRRSGRGDSGGSGGSGGGSSSGGILGSRRRGGGSPGSSWEGSTGCRRRSPLRSGTGSGLASTSTTVVIEPPITVEHAYTLIGKVLEQASREVKATPRASHTLAKININTWYPKADIMIEPHP